jgi:hypothetical protein
MVAIKNGYFGCTVYICVVGESIQPHMMSVCQTTAYVAVDGGWKEISFEEINLRAAFGHHRDPISIGVGTPGHDYPV